MENGQESFDFGPSELQLLESLNYLGFHPIVVLHHLRPPLVWSSVPLRCLHLQGAVFLKTKGSSLERFNASELEAVGIILSKSLADENDNNWTKYDKQEKHITVASHHDSVPPLTKRKISDCCFEVSAPETKWTVLALNFVCLNCEERSPMFAIQWFNLLTLLSFINHKLGKIRHVVEDYAGNIIWLYKHFWKIISKVVPLLLASRFSFPKVCNFVQIDVTEAFGNLSWSNLEPIYLVDPVKAVFLLLCFACIVLGGRIRVCVIWKEIRAMFVRCFNLLLQLSVEFLRQVGECARDGFNFRLLSGMLVLLMFDEPKPSSDLVKKVCYGGMAYVLLYVVTSKCSTPFGLILAGGVVLSSVVLLCWQILCTVPPEYFL